MITQPSFNFMVFEDESLFSIATRVCMCSGHSSLGASRALLLGSESKQCDSLFPPYIPQLSTLTNIGREALLDKHSILNFFRPFIPSHVYETVYYRLLEGETKNMLSQLGLVSSHLPIHSELRYCKLCVIEDGNSYGIPYWHRQHQLPGVTVCTKHHMKLVGCKRIRKSLYLPSTEEPDNHEPCVSSSLLIANACEQFLYAKNIHLDPQTLKLTYLKSLEMKGMTSNSLRVRQLTLRSEMLDFWGDLMNDKIIRGIFKDKTTTSYPSNLLYNPANIHHPLKHILLILFLFEDPSIFYNSYASVRSKRDIYQPPAKCAVKASLTSSPENSIVALLRSGFSLRQIAQTVDVSVGLVKATAARNCIQTDRRPSKIFNHEKRAIWRKLHLGDSTQKIAKLFNTSNSAIEQILSEHPTLVQIREKIRFFKKRLHKRQEILKFLDSHRLATRNEVLGHCGAAYIWLFKNDKNWLYDNLPPEIPRSARYSRTS